MVKDRSLDLQELAQRVAETLSFADEALLTGSASRGEADELSDVELLLVAEELPPVASLSARPAAAGMRVVVDGEQADGQALWVDGVAGDDCFEVMGRRAHLRPGGRLPLSQVFFEDAQNVLRVMRMLLLETLLLAPELHGVMRARAETAQLLEELA
jgi:hypothetical protein